MEMLLRMEMKDEEGPVEDVESGRHQGQFEKKHQNFRP